MIPKTYIFLSITLLFLAAERFCVPETQLAEKEAQVLEIFQPVYVIGGSVVGAADVCLSQMLQLQSPWLHPSR